ncbi:unnamed protein product, partial [Porites lobata]
MTQNKMGEDAESDFAFPFVEENDYSEISAKAVSAKRKLKKNRPSSLTNYLCNRVYMGDALSVPFIVSWCTLGMKLLSIHSIPNMFNLYFLACTDERPPSDDVNAVEIREWLWKRPYTTLELQHYPGTDRKYNTAD